MGKSIHGRRCCYCCCRKKCYSKEASVLFETDSWLLGTLFRMKEKLISKMFVYKLILTHSSPDCSDDLGFLSSFKTFDTLTTVVFRGCKSTGARIENMQHMLKNVESIEPLHFEYTDNSFVKIANYCSKLKRLNIQCCKLVSTLFLQYFITP